MSRKIVLPVLMWSISTSGADDPPPDQPVIELEAVTVYRRRLSLINEAGRNFKVAVSYRF
ncbi:MAG: hypothetical protein M3436_08345 [Pseudomonadota bacterium]|nr:hypothetical protein [Pseudomonadota bacterium]